MFSAAGRWGYLEASCPASVWRSRDFPLTFTSSVLHSALSQVRHQANYYDVMIRKPFSALLIPCGGIHHSSEDSLTNTADGELC